MALATTTEQDCMDAIKDLLDAVTFEAGIADDRIINASRIRVAMLPATNETIGECPCIVICPHKTKKVEQEDFEGGASGRSVTVEISIIEAIEGDMATEQNKIIRWQGQAINKLEREDYPRNQWRHWPTLVPAVWDFSIDDASVIDRGKLGKNYAYQTILMTFQTHE